MPLICALICLYRHNDETFVREYWQRLLNVRLIKPPWYLMVFLCAPILVIVSSVIDTMLGGQGANPHRLAGLLSKPMTLVAFAVFMLLFGPLPEEMAWRGYALTGLQKKLSALTASLIIGAAWTVWHLPLFWIEGSYQNNLGVGTLPFWFFMLDKIPQSIVMAWIFNNNRQSTASAVFFHFAVNITGELVDQTTRAETIYIISWWVLAMIIIMLYEHRNFIQLRAQVHH